jgi:hypothetical protein
MPRKLMTASTNIGSTSRLNTSAYQALDNGPDLEGLRNQASDIIDSILLETGPEGSEIRDRLRRCVSRNRGYPERALLQHLMSTRPRSQSPISA